MKEELVSVVILTYNNFKYLYDALNSVFEQNHENIEIVISNDASKDFDEESLINFLNHNKPDNIKNVTINNNSRNIGTVGNFNNAIKMSTGDFILFLAGDDMLDNSSVITDYLHEFKMQSDDVMLINSAVSLYDNNMENPYLFVPDQETKDILNNITSNQLFNELAVRGCFFPTTCCVKRQLFEKIGFVSSDVKLIEDWALYLMVLRNCVSIHYMDKCTLKHRSGGICHGGENYTENLNKDFKKDELTIIKQEILEYSSLLTKQNKKKMLRKFNELKAVYDIKYEWENKSISWRLKYILKELPSLINKSISVVRHAFISILLTHFNSNQYIIRMIILLVLFYFADFSDIMGYKIQGIVHLSLGSLSLLFIFFFILSIIVRGLYQIYIPLKSKLKK